MIFKVYHKVTPINSPYPYELSITSQPPPLPGSTYKKNAVEIYITSVMDKNY